MSLRMFADLHHNALYHSLQLMGKRVGFEVYRPIGLSWFDEGFWGIGDPYPDPRNTARQFLEISNEDVVNGSPGINKTISAATSGSYVCEDKTNETFNYALELELFKSLKFDCILASIPFHWEKYRRLRDLYQPQAKLIAQFGNLGWQIPDYPNILDSTGTYNCPDKHYLAYRQEYNEKIFTPRLDLPPNNHIRSFNLDFNDRIYLDQLRNLCSGYVWDIYSVSSCSDFAPVTGISKLAGLMQDSLMGMHLKSSDGFGHLVHNWSACGVPLIVSENYDTGIFTKQLLVDKLTCIKLGNDPVENMNRINWACDFENNQILRDNVRKVYKNCVNFDYDTDKLAHFFANLRD